MPTYKEFAVDLGSGRAVEVAEGGDPTGKLVFAMHGTPGSRMLYGPHLEHAMGHGIRLIGFSRPGYGSSTRWKGHTKVDVASVVAGIADSLGIEKFGVWGHSGGGNYALGCAAALPDRVVGVASLSTFGPYPAAGLDFFAGMGEYNVEDFRLMLSNEAAWETKSHKDAEVMAKQSKAERMKMLGSLISEVDQPFLTDELDEFLHSQSIEGLRNGDAGWIDDSLGCALPWGFEPAAVRVPAQVWHGKHDKFVPFSHGQWLAAQVPGAEAHLEEDDGHISMYVNRIPEVQEWLASRF